MEVSSFKTLMEQAMLEYGLEDKKGALLDLEYILIDNGITNITRKRLSEYKTGKKTPPFIKAKYILEALGLEMSDEEIEESLELNREEIRNENPYGTNKDISKIISLNISDIVEGRAAFENNERMLTSIVEIIEDRIEAIYGDKRKWSKYVADLIAADIFEEE